MSQVAAPDVPRRAKARARQQTYPATFITVATGNDVYWRVEAPAAAIGAKTVMLTDQEKAVELFKSPNRSRLFPWNLTAEDTLKGAVTLSTAKEWKTYVAGSPQVTSVTAVFPKVEGAAIFTRPCLARATLAKGMRDTGIRTIAETDDNYFCDASQNLFLRSQEYTDEGREQHAKAMASMDANIFSTPWLRDRYHREYRQRFGKKGLPEMHVCRNHVPRDAWPERVETDGPLRVGFMGSTSHVWDVNLAYAAFHAAHGMGCETWMIGYSPTDPDPDLPDTYTNGDTGETFDLRSEKSRAAITKWRGIIDVHKRWISPAEYHRVALPLDIGLAPLLWNDFTAGKSDVKAIEYAISGAVPVLQTHPIYSSAGWKDGVNCLMGSDHDSLARAVIRLIREPKLRFDLVSAAQELVFNERNEEVMRDEWTKAVNG